MTPLFSEKVLQQIELIRRLEGTEAVYSEGILLARVRLDSIKFDHWGMTSMLVRTAEPVMRSAKQYSLPESWDIAAAWGQVHCEGLRWWCPQVSWTLYFGPSVLNWFDQCAGDHPKDGDACELFNRIYDGLHKLTE